MSRKTTQTLPPLHEEQEQEKKVSDQSSSINLMSTSDKHESQNSSQEIGNEHSQAEKNVITATSEAATSNLTGESMSLYQRQYQEYMLGIMQALDKCIKYDEKVNGKCLRDDDIWYPPAFDTLCFTCFNVYTVDSKPIIPDINIYKLHVMSSHTCINCNYPYAILKVRSKDDVDVKGIISSSRIVQYSEGRDGQMYQFQGMNGEVYTFQYLV